MTELQKFLQLHNQSKIFKNNFQGQVFIYFLYDNGDVVYVGQTKRNIETRIACHNRTKKFDSYSFTPCDEKKVDEIEAKLIWNIRPIFNSDVNLRFLPFVTLAAIKRSLLDFKIRKNELNHIAQYKDLKGKMVYSKPEVRDFLFKKFGVTIESFYSLPYSFKHSNV